MLASTPAATDARRPRAGARRHESARARP
jgi:hypothetical protein